MTLRYSDKTEVNYEFQQAEYHWKDGGWSPFGWLKDVYEHFASNRKKLEFNGVFTIEDYDLSPYHDQPGKFEREESEGVKIEQALFFILLILPNGGSSESAKMLDAAELVKKGFFIHKDQVLPAEDGRPLSLGTPRIEEIDLEQKKMKLKVRVKAKKQGELQRNKIEKNYEKKRVFWAAVMMRTEELGTTDGSFGATVDKRNKNYNEIKDCSKNMCKSNSDQRTLKYPWWKIPIEIDWKPLVNSLLEVNNWENLENTSVGAIAGIPQEKPEFNVRLFSCTSWSGNFACLEYDLSEFFIDENEEWALDKFYLNKGRHIWHSRYYIFPIVVDRECKELEYIKEEGNSSFLDWSKQENNNINWEEGKLKEEQKALSIVSISHSDLWSLPKNSAEVLHIGQNNRPTKPEDKKYYVTGRFYDYAVGTYSVNGTEYNDRCPLPFDVKGFSFALWKTQSKKPFGTHKVGYMNHNGIDLHALAGDKICAVASGTICATGPNFKVLGNNDKYSGPYEGFSVIISHGKSLYTHYAHMSNTLEIEFKNQRKRHGEDFNMRDTVELIYEGATLVKVSEGGQADINIPEKVEKGSLEKQCIERYPLVGRTVEAGDLIGHSGKKGSDHTFSEHLHFEIIYIKGDGGDEKSSFPTNKNFYYLNPEYFFANGVYSYDS